MLGKSNRPGFSTLTPYLMVAEVGPIVEFLEKAFGAEETFRTTGGGGGTHVELRIGDSMLMVGGGDNDDHETPPVAFFLYVEDVDAVYRSAVEAGASELMTPENGLFGEERGAGVMDPFGNQWFFGHHAPE